MNERMEREIERTVAALRQSLPRRGKSGGMPALLGVAARELSAPVLLAIVAGTAAFGALLAAVLNTPLLTAFCTAPLPAMLSLHRFVLSVNEPMRELEMTLRYSYAEMMTARTLLVLLWSMLALLALSLVLWSKTGEGFVRLALAGAAPGAADVRAGAAPRQEGRRGRGLGRALVRADRGDGAVQAGRGHERGADLCLCAAGTGRGGCNGRKSYVGEEEHTCFWPLKRASTAPCARRRSH